MHCIVQNSGTAPRKELGQLRDDADHLIQVRPDERLTVVGSYTVLYNDSSYTVVGRISHGHFLSLVSSRRTVSLISKIGKSKDSFPGTKAIVAWLLYESSSRKKGFLERVSHYLDQPVVHKNLSFFGAKTKKNIKWDN